MVYMGCGRHQMAGVLKGGGGWICLKLDTGHFGFFFLSPDMQSTNFFVVVLDACTRVQYLTKNALSEMRIYRVYILI